jgi:hypothetical protein
MLNLMAGQSAAERADALRDMTTAKLIRHEMRAATALFESLPKVA